MYTFTKCIVLRLQYVYARDLQEVVGVLEVSVHQ